MKFLPTLCATLILSVTAAFAAQVPNPTNAPSAYTPGNAVILGGVGNQQMIDAGVAPGSVLTATSLSNFRTLSPAAGVPQIWLAGFYAAGDPGAGLFNRKTCTDDGGVCIRANDGSTWLRAFTGAVHTAWYGVIAGSVLDATTTGCLSSRSSCDAVAQINAALTAAQTYGNKAVSTDCVSFVLWSAGVTIPTGATLESGCEEGGYRTQNNSTGYFKQPGAIVLNAGTWSSPTGYTITRGTNSIFRGFIGLPQWYTSAPSTMAQSIANSRSYIGTFTTCAVQKCDMSDMLLLGFNVCDDTSGSARTIEYDVKSECSVNLFSHSEKGITQFHDFIGKEYLETQLKSGGVPLSSQSWPNTAISADANNQITVTISTAGLASSLQDGYQVGVSGTGQSNTVNTSGNIDYNGSGACGIAMTICNVPPNDAAQINVGDTVSDRGIAGCIPGGVIVYNIDNSDPDNVTLYITNATCNVSSESLRFFGSFAGPVSANGPPWTIHCLNSNPCTQFTLLGSSFTGPTIDTSLLTFKGGTSIIQVPDTTNIVTGQYICASGTAPICTPPANFVASTTTSSNISSLGSGSVGDIAVGSTLKWPTGGLVKVDNELLLYAIPSGYGPNRISIVSRGEDGTTPASHSNGSTLTPSAPQVIAVSAAAERVFVNAVANNSSGSTTTFANDPASYGTYFGATILSALYHYWSGDPRMAGTPEAQFAGTANAAGGTSTITALVNGWKAYPGKQVTDSTTHGNIPSAAYVCTQNTSGGPNNVTITLAASYDYTTNACGAAVNASAFTGDLLSFTGCGFPYQQPWAGDCPGEAYQFGNPSAGKSDTQGTVFYSMTDHGHRVAFRLSNAPASTASLLQAANGGGAGADVDPSSYCMLVDGGTNKTVVTSSVFQGCNHGIAHAPQTTTDGNLFSDIEVDFGSGGLALENAGPIGGTNVTFHGIHGHKPGVAFLQYNQTAALLTDNDFPNVTLIYGQQGSSNAAASTSGCGNFFVNYTGCVGISPSGAGLLSVNSDTYLDGLMADISCDSTAGNVNLYLPRASAQFLNKRYNVQNVALANSCIVNRQGNDTVGGGSSVSITGQWATNSFQSIGVGGTWSAGALAGPLLIPSITAPVSCPSTWELYTDVADGKLKIISPTCNVTVIGNSP